MQISGKTYEGVAGSEMRVCMRAQSIVTASTAAAQATRGASSAQPEAPLVNVGLDQLLLSVATVRADGSLLNLKLDGEQLPLVYLQCLNAAVSLPKQQQIAAAANQPEQRMDQAQQQAPASRPSLSALSTLPSAQPAKAQDMHVALSMAELHVWAGDAPAALAAALAQDAALSGLRALRARPEAAKKVSPLQRLPGRLQPRTISLLAKMHEAVHDRSS